MDYEKQLEAVINYIKSGEKHEEDFTIGMEMEHFIVDKDSLKTVSYWEKTASAQLSENFTKEDVPPTRKEILSLDLKMMICRCLQNQEVNSKSPCHRSGTSTN